MVCTSFHCQSGDLGCKKITSNLLIWRSNGTMGYNEIHPGASIHPHNRTPIEMWQPELLLKNVWPISQFSSQDNFDNVERIKDNLANSPLVTITWVIVRSSNESVRRALPNLRYVWTKRRSRFEVEQTLSSQSIECLRDPNMQHIQKTNGQALQLHGLHGLLKRLPPIACLWEQMC